jgi:hypothetical protein
MNRSSRIISSSFTAPVRAFVVQLLFVSALGLGCSSNSTTAPSPPGQQPPPAVSFVNMAGSWSGTLESSTHQTRTITMTVVQDGSCVDGVWTSTQDQWTGAISGYAAADSFSGEISIATVNELGERCTGVGNTSGPVDAGSLRLTSPGMFSVVIRCNSLLPQSVVLTLRRN